jgi:hypothetical protein
VLVYDFSVLTPEDAEKIETSAMAAEMLERIQSISRAASTVQGMLVAVTQDVITV